ncbi:NADH dehydrogenase [ubiquinone] flavoprotein 3, mitochondrial [Sceloporus undulatus]|uniref:NADH dehydrogenase [ubiquinone] flavoprotein 3, mitochondrial n=1 Tax=Sceloporus undulatus TaxID=8520 RepID=UPI001C4CBE2B|nr:NADH dehydrogenase [ubiquinone] flavoprotein 3, mitochondrial [Sceloporus undulatus]
MLTCLLDVFEYFCLRRLQSALDEGETITNTKADAALKLADEDLRKFLVRKTLVAFPHRANLPPLEGGPVFSSARDFRKKSEDEGSSSSSSSDSDSSSEDDDGDDDGGEGFKEIIKTKVSFPRRDPILSGDSTMKVNITSEKNFAQERVKSKQPKKLLYSLKITETPIKQEQFYQEAADNKLLKSDLEKHAIKQSPKERPLKNTDMGTKIVENQRSAEITSKQLKASIPEAASSTLSQTKPMLQQGVQNLTLLNQKASTTNEVQNTEIQRTAAVLQEVVLDDRTPVAETTEKEDMVLEAGVQTEQQQSTLQETKPPVEPAQETFDISSYKNLQHHEYTPYTFVDFDVLLSKLRLPQPSSGRLSPRH